MVDEHPEEEYARYIELGEYSTSESPTPFFEEFREHIKDTADNTYSYIAATSFNTFSWLLHQNRVFRGFQFLSTNISAFLIIPSLLEKGTSVLERKITKSDECKVTPQYIEPFLDNVSYVGTTASFLINVGDAVLPFMLDDFSGYGWVKQSGASFFDLLSNTVLFGAAYSKAGGLENLLRILKQDSLADEVKRYNERENQRSEEEQ
jgi:hypothetical protein